jgi:hypothetical protein
MTDEQQTPSLDLRDVEAELTRLPDVAAVRIVSNDAGRPVEIHVLANTNKPAKQVVRDIQSVALATFGLDIDRRIVSVVQLGPNGASTPEPAVSDTQRTALTGIQTSTGLMRTTIQVTLTQGTDEAVGFAEGSISKAARMRLVASATIDALRQLVPSADHLDVEAARLERVGEEDVVVVTMVWIDPPLEHSLSGSAIVRQQPDDAVVRAVLNGTNRRLPFLTRDHDGD